MLSRTRSRALRLLAFGPWVALGCDSTSSTGPTAPTPVASIRVDAPTTEVHLGGSLQLTAVPLSATGAELTGRGVHWTSESPEQVSVSATGRVQGLSLGEAVVWASSEDVSTRVVLAVVPAPFERLVLSVTALELTEGDSVQLTAEVQNELGEVVPGRPVVWSSLNPTAAPIANGWVFAAREGLASVRATSGVLVATATVRVRRELVGELLMVSTDVDEGGPRIFRTDLRDGPQSIVPWQAAGISKHPRLSPDGTRVAYTCHEDGTTQGSAICVADRDGGNAVVLTAGDAYYEDEPTWSPDGLRIAFRRWEATFGWPGWTIPTDIWAMDANGTNQENLTDDEVSQHQPAWSPVPVDGEHRIAFVEEEIVNNQRRTWIATMHVNGSDRRNETGGSTKVELTPTWSPDAAQLLYSREDFGETPQLYVLDVAAGSSRPFLPYTLGGGQLSPAWSPDGQFVAFSSAHDSANGHDWQVYTVRADGSRLVRRTSGGAGRGQLEWLPQGPESESFRSQ